METEPDSGVPTTADREEKEPRSACRRYYGKYRGTVLSNVDPQMEMRLLVQVPDVAELSPTTWAKPAVPSAGLQNGIVSLPPIQSGVWIEFEQGDPDFPVWTGSFWRNAAEAPVLARMITPGVSGVAMQTTMQNGMVISDVPGPAGGVMLKQGAAFIKIDDTGITIQNGRGAMILLSQNQVIINGGALIIQ